MKRILVFTLLFVLVNVSPVVSNQVPPVVGALIFIDLALGTVYKAGGVVRTAAHVAPYLIWAGIPGEIIEPDLVSTITCVDAPTDSATLTTRSVMQDYEVGPTPKLGSEVTAIGLLNGRWPPYAHKSIIDRAYKTRQAESVTVGPMIGMPFDGRANGMSGGPILYQGKAVATISMFGDGHLYAVPISAQHCPPQGG